MATVFCYFMNTLFRTTFDADERRNKLIFIDVPELSLILNRKHGVFIIPTFSYNYSYPNM